MRKVREVNKALSHERPRKRLRVLIADDTKAIRESMSGLISNVPDVEIVALAQTGTEALELIRSLKPDAVTLDIRMPGLSGIQVLEAIRREGLQVMALVLTGLAEAEAEYREKCLALGAKHFFHKATEFEMVVEVLQREAGELRKR